MSTGLHKDLIVTERHPVPSLEYANTAARTGDTSLTAAHKGSVARQTDDDTYWLLKDETPTWIQLHDAAGGTDVNVKVSANDTTTNYLENKVAGGTGVSLSVLNEGANEQLEVNVPHTTQTDNPHSVTAAQVGASPTGHTHAHADTTGQTANDHHNEIHTVASHSDTTATGAQLNELVGGGETTLHSHAGGASVFGADYQTAVSLSRDTTTSTSYQDKTTLTTPALTGTYRVGWMAVVDHGSVNSSMDARLYNVTDDAVVGIAETMEPKDLSDRRHIGGFAEVVFTGSAKTFKIQYKAQSSTAGIQDARIEIWRVS